MDLKGSLIDSNLRIIPSNKLTEFLKTIPISYDLPHNITHILKNSSIDKFQSYKIEFIKPVIQLTSADIDKLKLITEKCVANKEEDDSNKEPLKEESADKKKDTDLIKPSEENLETVESNLQSNNENKTSKKESLDMEEGNNSDLYHKNPFLMTSDIDWLYEHLKNRRSNGEKDIPYLHNLLEGASIEVPENEIIKRNPVLEARCVKLRAQQETREYRKMTKSVDNVRMRFPEDSISYQLKQLNRQLIAIGQFIISIFAGFLFGFRGVEWMVLVKWIYVNQHKMQTIRCCSSLLRYKEVEETVQVEPEAVAVPQTKPRPDIVPEVSFKYSDLQVRLAAPYQLQPKPEASELGFGKYFTDHMMRVHYYKQLGGWQKPEITPFEHLTIHPAAKALHYAIQLFEGMKAYRGVDDKIRLFRPDLNMERMNLAAQRSGLPMFDGEELIKCIVRLVEIDQEWVPHSETSTLYIRPTLIGTEATFGIMEPDSALLFVILSPVSAYYKARSDGAVSIYADPNVVRAFPGGVGNRKVGSNYGPTIETTARAAKLGHQQVLWLFGPDKELTEVGAMNIFVVYINEQGDKQLSTPPLNGLILPGVTRRSILELAAQWEDLTVKEEVLTMERLLELNKKGRLLEMFGAGTAVVVTPISNIGYLDQNIHIPTMKQPQPVFQRLKDTLLAIQYGHIEHPFAKIIS